MFLHKFCHEDKALPTSPTIRFGALHWYRKAEEAIKDEAEGRFDFLLDVKRPTILTSDALSLLMGGVISFGSESKMRLPGVSQFIGDRIIVTQESNGKHCLQVGSAIVSFSIPDKLIFCMSAGERSMKNPIVGGSYNAKWSVPIRRSAELSKALSRSLLSELSIENFRSLKGKPFLLGEMARFRCEHGHVIYGERSFVFDGTKEITKDFIIALYRSIPFRKPLKYSHEREYRFVFECVYQDKVYPPSCDAIVARHDGVVDLLE